MMKISFIVPLHNEGKNTATAVKRIVNYAKRQKWDFEIIAVDDRSDDKTAEILKQLSLQFKPLKPLFRKKSQEEKGNTMGSALKEGTNAAKGDLVIWTMGDLADDVETYQKIVAKIEEGNDMVFGSRYMPGGSRGNLDPVKAFLSSWGTILSRFFFGIKVHDITNAFRGFKKEVFSKLILQSTGFSISPEFAIKAHLAGFRLGEVPTVYTNRKEGVSSFKLFKMIRSYLSVYLLVFLKYKVIGKEKDFIS